MKTALRILKGLIFFWGAASILPVTLLAGYLIYSLTPGNKERSEFATPNDVRFVLNWCGLGGDRIQKVVHSYKSSTSFRGQYFEGYQIETSHVGPAELKAPDKSGFSGWFRGDHLPPVVAAALDGMSDYVSEVPFFPGMAGFRPSEYYVYPESISFVGTKATGMQLIFIRPSDNMVFYFAFQM